jgi:hypothetical protein
MEPIGHGVKYDQLEALLLRIDEVLARFASANGMKLSKNYHDFPERSLTWDSNLRRLIQLYPDGSGEDLFNLWVCVSQDRGSRRYWKTAYLRRKVSFGKIESELHILLDQGRDMANSWLESDLEPATDLFP